MNYYECHITVAPVFGEELERFKAICAPYQFRVAKLLMEKGPSTKDSFCTGHSKTYEDMDKRMRTLTSMLQLAGYKVWRRKIEHVIFDEKFAKESA